MHRSALGRAAADQALDAVLGHEIERPLGPALNRLPAFDRQPQWSGHDGQLFEGVAAIGHLRRQGVVLALVRERLVVERLEDDVDLLFEQFAIGRLVEQWRAEGLDLAGMVAAPDAKRDASAAENVGGGIILGQPQRMPHRGDVEAAADPYAPGHMRQMQRHHQHVGNALVALVLEMVLGHPESVVAQTIHQLRHRLRLVEDGGEMLVGIAAVVHRDAAIADIFDIDVPGEQTVEFCNHAMTSTGEPPIDFLVDCTPWFRAGNRHRRACRQCCTLNDAVVDCPGSTSRLLLPSRGSAARAIPIPNRREMRCSALIATIVAGISDRGPAVAEQAGGRITAEQPDIGRDRNAHPEIRSGAGRHHPTRPPARGRDGVSGRLLFPEQHAAGFLALRAERRDAICTATVNPPVGGCN